MCSCRGNGFPAELASWISCENSLRPAKAGLTHPCHSPDNQGEVLLFLLLQAPTKWLWQPLGALRHRRGFFVPFSGSAREDCSAIPVRPSLHSCCESRQAIAAVPDGCCPEKIGSIGPPISIANFRLQTLLPTRIGTEPIKGPRSPARRNSHVGSHAACGRRNCHRW
jgi:hypothetical protein